MSEEMEHLADLETDCEVWFGRSWRPALIAERRKDGWCRAVVNCAGSQRELTFSPREVRNLDQRNQDADA